MKDSKKEVEKYNMSNYHSRSETWGWIDDTFEEVIGGVENEEGIKSQLIAEELGLTAEEE